MTGETIYPKADTKSQWYYGGRFAGQGVTMPMDKGVKWLQHTTETAGGWPTYGDGAICPTLTFEPWLHQWRQHMPVNHSARALKGDGTAYTNRSNVIQTEISCYCDQALAEQQKRMDRFVGNIDAQAIDMLGDFGVWMHEKWGMAVEFYPAQIPWPAYNGQNRITRLTVAQYDAFSGILGHMAAPAETHLDPSSLDNVAVRARIEQQLGGGGGAGSDPWGTIALTEAMGGLHSHGVHVTEEFDQLLAKHPKAVEWKALRDRHVARQAEATADHTRAYHLSHKGA